MWGAFLAYVITIDRVQNFVTDTAVDFVSSAAAAGMGLDYVANNIEIKDFDGDGQKDSAVDGLKHLVDMGCNKLGGMIFG